MQCKGDFDYPERGNWSAKAETQRASVAPKNYSTPSKHCLLALKALQDLATPFILPPMIPTHVPLNWASFLRMPPCFSFAYSHSFVLNYKPYLSWKVKAKFLLFHQHCLKKSPLPCLSSLSLWQLIRAPGICYWAVCVSSPLKAEIRAVVSEWYTEHVFRISTKFE